ncbi:ATP-binding protein [Arenimonas sp.]|uniref:ATP-binding protein n=1 Tax=Arenimonas sp. TaxID=1872635 RepID=UPI0035B0B529
MRIRLKVPREQGQLRDLVAAIDGVLAREGVDPAVVHDVQLVTEEVVCNALDYGRVEGREHEISVGIGIDDGLITLEFRDDCVAFNPLERPDPDLDADIEERPIGGLGVHLIRQLAEEVSYARQEPHNILRVVLRTQAPGSHA